MVLYALLKQCAKLRTNVEQRLPCSPAPVMRRACTNTVFGCQLTVRCPLPNPLSTAVHSAVQTADLGTLQTALSETHVFHPHFFWATKC